MKHQVVRVVTRAMDSSATARVVRPMIAGSGLCALGAGVAASVWRTRERIIAGLGGEWSDKKARRSAAQIDALAAQSRVVKTLRSWSLAPSVACREGVVGQMLDLILSLDLQARVSVGGGVTVVAVLTHTFVLTALGVPVQLVGWSIRAGLVAVGLLLLRRPDAVAAAWNDKSAPSTSTNA